MCSSYLNCDYFYCHQFPLYLGRAAFTLFSIGTGAMFSPPAVIIISEEENKTKR